MMLASLADCRKGGVWGEVWGGEVWGGGRGVGRGERCGEGGEHKRDNETSVTQLQINPND